MLKKITLAIGMLSFVAFATIVSTNTTKTSVGVAYVASNAGEGP